MANALKTAGLVALLGVAGCSTPRLTQPSAPVPPAIQASPLSVTINASVRTVKTVIVERARSRGSKVTTPDARSIVLQRALADTPPALAALCGAHRAGRLVSVLITADAQGRTTTAVTEQRFVVDADGNRCAIVLGEADRAEGQKSLNDLKAQIESGGVAR